MENDFDLIFSWAIGTPDEIYKRQCLEQRLKRRNNFESILHTGGYDFIKIPDNGEGSFYFLINLTEEDAEGIFKNYNQPNFVFGRNFKIDGKCGFLMDFYVTKEVVYLKDISVKENFDEINTFFMVNTGLWKIDVPVSIFKDANEYYIKKYPNSSLDFIRSSYEDYSYSNLSGRGSYIKRWRIIQSLRKGNLE